MKVIYQKLGGPGETRTEFFVRVGNGTRALYAVERAKYAVSPWDLLSIRRERG